MRFWKNIVKFTRPGGYEGRKDKSMKRKFVNIIDAPKVAGVDEWWQIEIENMGWCKDDVTRWYWFDAEDGTPCYTLKH